MTKRPILFYLFLLLIALFVTTSTYAQAAEPVTGASVTIPKSNVVSLIVDSAYTGTVEDGSESHPFKAINKAITNADILNAQAKNVRIRIKSGIGYREQVNIEHQANTNDIYTLTLEGFSAKSKPSLFGSERWTGDTFQIATPNGNNGNNTVYSHAGGTPWGIQEDTWEIHV
jgi:hypothetical protein